MRQNVLDEIQKPLQKPRQTQVIKTHQIVRDPQHYQLYTFPEYKRYQLVYDKRVVDPITFQTFPYGYRWHAFLRGPHVLLKRNPSHPPDKPPTEYQGETTSSRDSFPKTHREVPLEVVTLSCLSQVSVRVGLEDDRSTTRLS